MTISDNLQSNAKHFFRIRMELQDCVFGGLVVLLSLVLYVPDLGFYSRALFFEPIFRRIRLSDSQGILRT